MITLAITPLRWLTGINQLVNYRRIVGLFAFFYGSIHFTTYVVTTFFIGGFSNFDASGLADDLTTRPYIIAGFTAFVLMIPLAVTSTAGWIRRLGGKRWNLLHRLVYLSGIFGVIHYLWLVKADTSRPIRYGVIIGSLLLARLFLAWRGRVAATRASASA